MITGKYGVIKLTKDEAGAFLYLLKQYKLYEGKEYSPEDAVRILDLNKQLQKYTGIDPRKHPLDFSKIRTPNVKERNYLYVETARTEYSNFLISTYRKLELIKNRIGSVFFEEEEDKRNLTLPFEYRFYDAFNEGQIFTDVDKFEYLVGHSYKTGIEGIRTGYAVAYESPKGGGSFSSFDISYEISIPSRIVQGELDFLLNQILFYLKEYVPVYFMTGILPEPKKVKHQKLQFKMPF
jgi:hypothetical protein